MDISILMLTHNAPKYVYKSITTIKNITKTNIKYEILVVDNKSSLFIEGNVEMVDNID